MKTITFFEKNVFFTEIGKLRYTAQLLFYMVRRMDSMLLTGRAFSVFLYFSFSSLVVASYFTQKYAQVDIFYFYFIFFYILFFLINEVPEQSHTRFHHS